MSTEPIGLVVIGAREIYDQCVQTQRLVERIAMQIDGHAEKLADHELRLDAIEKTRWPLSPAALLATLMALASIVMQVLPKLIH